MDNVSAATRSRTMAAVRSKGNRSTERKLRARLAALGVRGWRLNASDLAGCPDFVFDAPHVAVFLDGCFWHGCPRCQRVPSSNQEYWVAKVQRNRRRDRRTAAALREQGWTVLRIWEHELRLAPRRVVSRIVAALQD